MFDKRRKRPFFLAPGVRISFQRVDRASLDRINQAVEAGTFDWQTLIRQSRVS